MGSAGQTCAKAILGTFNILFTLIGLALLVVGSLLKWSPDFVNTHLQTILDKIPTGGFRIDIAVLLQDLTTISVVMGAVLLTVGLLGIIGICAKQPVLLLIYSSFLLLFVLAEIVFVVLMYVMKEQMATYIKDILKTTITENYRGDNFTDAVSLTWNFLQATFSCCGAYNVSDYKDAALWSNAFSGPGGSVQLKGPLTCCNMTGTFPQVTPSDLPTCIDPNTPDDSTAHNYDLGCYDAIEAVILENKILIICLGAGTMLVQILIVASACYLFKKAKSEKDKVKPWR